MRRRIAAALVALVAVGLGVVAMPRPPALATTTSGDPALIERVQRLADGGTRDRLSVAVIEGDRVTVANFGADGGTEYEIGSVTKTITGALLAQGLERGEVDADMTLGDTLGIDSGAAEVSLESLGTQSSGLPRLPGDPGLWAWSMFASFTARDPYAGNSLGRLRAQAASASVGAREYGYSNFGFALLGQALAAAAGADYAALARSRVFEPLGMDATRVPSVDERDLTTGWTSSGRPAQPWLLDAYAPAGSVRSTLDDMVRYATAMLDGSAPGAAALEPRADTDSGRIGYAWQITDDGVTWHNGMTGGFASFVGLDREAGTGVVVLSNTAVSVDRIGMELLP